MIKLESPFEQVIAAVPEVARGPGWSNNLVWVYILDSRDGTIRQEAIQGSQMSDEMHTLFYPCSAASRSMIMAVNSYIRSNQDD